MRDILDRLERFTNLISKWLNWVAGIGLVGMLALIVADVIGIKLFKNPIPGAIETVAFLGVVITAFAIAYTHVVRGHIQVEFFVMRLPERIKAIIASFVFLLGIILFAVLAWRSYEYGMVLQRTGEVSMTQGIPFYPFVHAVAFSCIPVCLVLLVELIKSVLKAVKR
ncbi:MAG TPA: TRAP transporter small permease [Dehalococcoidia bacterium]|nr:TRAP transporter small permease [Dehalococcoidia bacterium]